MNSSEAGFNPSFNMATIKQVFNEAVERVRMPTPMRLRDLIRQIRAARTAMEERNVVNRECAYIRAAFREEDSVWRCRNLAKLLYIHMLGYSAHFAQLECLKLIASARFTDKRIGYLGAMLLLDERQDVHLLITNSLKNDLNGPNQYVVGLALCTLGAIASPEMSRDLASEVERLLKSQSSDIRKKAAICAFRIIIKVPELMEMFLPNTRSLLSEKNHGILVTGVTLITEMCERNPDMLQHFKKIVPNLVRILKNLILAGYSPEHDVCGINDPFLQVKILKLLRILGRNDADASEAMNDILAQVATNTESNKNVGYTILYETVLSIMDIKSESGLRVLAVNILGRFLLNNDKNIRYVALNTLLKTVHIDTTAVQRHRSTILDCLEDMDVSIRKRALELSFALINAHNIRNVMVKLMKFLEKADPEFKAHCSSNIVLSAEKFSPSIRWHLDTLLNVLVAAGNYVRDDVVSSTIQLILESPNEQSYIVHQLWDALLNDSSDRQPLTQVATWVIGEFGDLLLSPTADVTKPVAEDEVIEVYQKLLWSPHNTIATKQYAINSLMKLSSRFLVKVNNIREIMQVFASHINMELQQRGSEYSQLFTKYDNMRPALLEKMPPLEVSNRNNNDGRDMTCEESPSLLVDESGIINTEMGNAGDANALLILLGRDSNDNDVVTTSNQTSSSNLDLLDLLGDLDGPPTPNPTSMNNLNNSSKPSVNNNNDILLLNSNSHNNTTSYVINTNSTSPLDDFLKPPTRNNGIEEMIAYDKNGLRIDFALKPFTDVPNTTCIDIVFKNNSNSSMTEFLFQAAVPKTFQLVMLPPSKTAIPSNSTATQVLRITNPSNSTLRMRVRLSYNQGGAPVHDQFELNDFPSVA